MIFENRKRGTREEYRDSEAVIHGNDWFIESIVPAPAGAWEVAVWVTDPTLPDGGEVVTEPCVAFAVVTVYSSYSGTLHADRTTMAMVPGDHCELQLCEDDFYLGIIAAGDTTRLQQLDQDHRRMLQEAAKRGKV